MSGKVIVLVGLPASGKTTEARRLINAFPEIVYSNKDAFRRLCYHESIDWFRGMEHAVCEMRDALIRSVLSSGGTVLIDDTNLSMVHIATIKSIALTYGAQVEMQDFTNIPLEVCLERNSVRTDKDRVPEDAIRDMHEKYFVNGRWKYAYLFEEGELQFE